MNATIPRKEVRKWEFYLDRAVQTEVYLQFESLANSAIKKNVKYFQLSLLSHLI